MSGHAYLAVELDTSGEPSAAHHVAVAEAAARTGADLLIWQDSFVPPAAGDPSTLDAVAVAARVAPVVPGVGLVPTVTVTHTEPFHVSKAIATLDLVSGGRAGWQVEVSRTEQEAQLFGRKAAAPSDELWREAAEAVEVVERLWDSWEDDAVIRDVETGSYVDLAKLHYLDFVGEFFSVRGPSITPRSPQGHALVVVRDEPDARSVIAAWADVARVSAPDPEGRPLSFEFDVACARRSDLRTAVAGTGRGPESIAVLLDLDVPASATAEALTDAIADIVRSDAADGVVLRGVTDLAAFAGLAARLVERGMRDRVASGAPLRDRFGLPRPANYFAGARS